VTLAVDRPKAWPVVCLVAFAFLAGAALRPAVACDAIDPELVYCPAPEPPRITELKAGACTLELQIGVDGTVLASRVASASGHPAWQAAARNAVARWRYANGSALRVRDVPFDFRPAQP